jgi:hypothetical protein
VVPLSRRQVAGSSRGLDSQNATRRRLRTELTYSAMTYRPDPSQVSDLDAPISFRGPFGLVPAPTSRRGVMGVKEANSRPGSRRDRDESGPRYRLRGARGRPPRPLVPRPGNQWGPTRVGHRGGRSSLRTGRLPCGRDCRTCAPDGSPHPHVEAPVTARRERAVESQLSTGGPATDPMAHRTGLNKGGTGRINAG